MIFCCGTIACTRKPPLIERWFCSYKFYRSVFNRYSLISASSCSLDLVNGCKFAAHALPGWNQSQEGVIMLLRPRPGAWFPNPSSRQFHSLEKLRIPFLDDSLYYIIRCKGCKHSNQQSGACFFMREEKIAASCEYLLRRGCFCAIIYLVF